MTGYYLGMYLGARAGQMGRWPDTVRHFTTLQQYIMCMEACGDKNRPGTLRYFVTPAVQVRITGVSCLGT